MLRPPMHVVRQISCPYTGIRHCNSLVSIVSFQLRLYWLVTSYRSPHCWLPIDVFRAGRPVPILAGSCDRGRNPGLDMSCQKPQKPRAGDEPDGAGGCRILRRGGCCISAALLPDARGCTRGPSSSSCPKENLSSHGGRRLLRPSKQRSPTLDPKWQQNLHSHVTDLTDMTNSAESSALARVSMNS